MTVCLMIQLNKFSAPVSVPKSFSLLHALRCQKQGGAAVLTLTHCLCLVMCRCVWFTLAYYRAILVLYIHVVDKVTDESSI